MASTTISSTAREVENEAPEALSSSSPIDKPIIPQQNRSRYPPGIEAILRKKGPELLESPLDELFSKLKGADRSPETIFRRPAQRSHTPPLSPRSVSPAHQSRGDWDLRGSRASADKWRFEFDRLRRELSHALRGYFSIWSCPKQARKLLKGYGRLSDELERMRDALRVLEKQESSTEVAMKLPTQMEAIDHEFAVFMDRGEEIYDVVTRRNVSTIGPLRGKELSWRKYRIARTMAPQMQQLHQELDEMRELVRLLQEGF